MKTKYSKFQLFLEIIGAAILISFFIFLVKSWSSIPERIPGHYNAAGVVDRWGNKNEILMLPIIGAILYLGLTIITFFPQIWNVPMPQNQENKEAVYKCMKTMLISLKVEITAMFFYITFHSVNSMDLPIAFLPIVLLIIFGSLTYFIVRSYRLSK
ncbi:Protein of unknown function [Clostridium amylolyticum]|uniref:DUF1648 domain-containing protein n=1 Tax=Clostridium amylolyticum TaxID=1121298 RepID=A0A1M6E9K9_9CLOT|nr:DUF1648 domain-containing protein [Clostridium amylolyticum]SHI82176.1 Protein of unknown function [Clostridium amylolyticum]